MIGDSTIRFRKSESEAKFGYRKTFGFSGIAIATAQWEQVDNPATIVLFYCFNVVFRHGYAITTRIELDTISNLIKDTTTITIFDLYRSFSYILYASCIQGDLNILKL